MTQTTLQPVDDRRWRSIQTRDATHDDTFIYAVRSTGIYCRPSCPSRKPGRDQAIFFPGPEAARDAGFRACKRCRPDDNASQAIELVRAACRAIDHADEAPPTLQVLARSSGVSPWHLQRTFKRIMGVTPRQYADARRVAALKACIKEGASVTDALYEAGYGSSSRLYEGSNAHLGMAPGSYRRGGAGMRIAYDIVPCPLGRLLVAATDRGVCAVSLGDDDGLLLEALGQEYPAPEIHSNPTLGAWTAAVVRHLAGQQPNLDLPLDLQATAFQRLVWEELQRIPYGETRTYGEIARAIGQPNAARAVGRACATNPAAVVIPCHRAVREDGGLGGYRWGLERKQALQDRERADTFHASQRNEIP